MSSLSDYRPSSPYDIAFFASGDLTSFVTGDVVAAVGLSRSTMFKTADANLGVAYAGTAGTGASDFKINVLDPTGPSTRQIGTVSFLAGEQIGTITIPSDDVVGVDEIIQITPDATFSDDIADLTITVAGCTRMLRCIFPSPPVVTLVAPSGIFFGTGLITGNDGSVDVTGSYTTLAWTSEYSTDSGETYLPDPGFNDFGHLIFSDPAILVPTVDDSGRGLMYRVTLVATGPGGSDSDSMIIEFAGA